MLKKRKEILQVLYNTVKNRMDFAVIGLSGGIDSAVAACICVKALGASNVYGYAMPYSRLDWIKYNLNSEEIARHLKINYQTIPINDAVDSYFDCIYDEMSIDNVAKLKSRVRSNFLYIYKQRLEELTQKKGCVIGTSNMTEMFLGSHIKGGDALGDIFVIGDILKSEVYNLSDYFKSKKMLKSHMIDFTPTSGLYGDKSRYDQIGYTYEQIEKVITDWKNFVSTPKEKDISELYKISDIHKFVLDSYFANKGKYSTNLIIPVRYLIESN